jgi:hypothetical protein
VVNSPIHTRSLHALGPARLFSASEPNIFRTALVESGKVLLTFFNKVIASLEMFLATLKWSACTSTYSFVTQVGENKAAG